MSICFIIGSYKYFIKGRIYICTRTQMIDTSILVSLITYDIYAMKSNNTAHIRNAVLVGEASLRRRIISFICDVCDVNRETYDPGAPGGLYLVHFGRNVLKLSWS